MERYEDKIEKALQYLKSPSRTDARGVSPIVYLVYKPEDAIIIRNVIDTYLCPKAEFYGFKVKFVSIGELIEKYGLIHLYQKKKCIIASNRRCHLMNFSNMPY